MASFCKHIVVWQVWMELEVSSWKFFEVTFFCCNWFRLQSMANHCNRREWKTDTLHTSFFSRTSHFIIDVHTHCLALDEPLFVSVWRALQSILMSSMMSVWSSVRCPSLRVCPSLVSLRCLPLLFHTPLVLWPALLPPCGQRQGKHPLRLCQMRSIAPWRFSIFPHIQTPHIQTRSFLARTLDRISKQCQAEVEAEMGNWKNQSSIMLEDCDVFFLHWPWGQKVQRNH